MQTGQAPASVPGISNSGTVPPQGSTVIPDSGSLRLPGVEPRGAPTVNVPDPVTQQDPWHGQSLGAPHRPPGMAPTQPQSLGGAPQPSRTPATFAQPAHGLGSSGPTGFQNFYLGDHTINRKRASNFVKLNLQSKQSYKNYFKTTSILADSSSFNC